MKRPKLKGRSRIVLIATAVLGLVGLHFGQPTLVGPAVDAIAELVQEFTPYE